VRWSAFASAEPELAAFGEERLRAAPAYLATVRADGSPRVHPFTPIFGAGGLYLFMEPTSPKGRDLRERGSFAIHNGVPDADGTGGECWLAGRGRPVDDDATRAEVARAASYELDERYVLFELSVTEVRCNGYGDVTLPVTTRWKSADPADAADPTS
jgi:hypothetical protein